ncbi:MAG: aldo/keto reductase [Proteobacteria bacterium]|nr:aldo/keto reductase [Pseudomonadota bacterium]
MTNIDFSEKTRLGRTNFKVSRLGIAAAYGISEGAVEKAVEEYGINYLHWDRKKPGMRNALKNLVHRKRDELVVAIQSYDHTGLMLRRGVEKGLKQLGIDKVDILFLGWLNKIPGPRILDVCRRLRDDGKVGFLGATGHNRRFHGEMAKAPDGPFDVLQVRYNAAHRGAEPEVFADLPENRPGITTYTATRWGKLLKAKAMPKGERPLTASECYRFVLSNPAVDVCLIGPRNEREMLEGLTALEQGPLTEEELNRIRRIGDHVHG